MKKILEIKDLKKYYGSASNLTKAVDGISFDVLEGEFVAIMGASGSGKTTLLNTVSTIDEPTSGEIIVNGVNLNLLKGKKIEQFRRENLGFIFQDFNLLDTLTAYENVALPLAIRKVSPNKQKEAVLKISKHLAIEEHLNKFPYQLSGGQKQRIAAARAIVGDPSLILADEPTGALDSKNARHLLESLVDLNQTLNVTIAMVTHDTLAASYAKRVIFLKDGVIYNQIYRGEKTREEYFQNIMDVVSVLGGE